MSKFNDFKAIIFPDDGTKKALVSAILSKGYLANDFHTAFAMLIYKVEEGDLQTILAPFLRALAIKHLREGTTDYVRAFRRQYDEVIGLLDTVEVGDARNVDGFLDQQSKAYVYATDIEAGALAEVLGATFAWTRVGNNDLPSGPPCVVYSPTQENGVIIHLYNRLGDHFFVMEGQYGSTIGDGNCLYNGFTQLIRQFILEIERNNINTYVQQAQIYEQIKNTKPMPIADLVARVRMQHPNKADDSALNAAVRIAQNDEKSEGLIPHTNGSSLPSMTVVKKDEMKSDVTLFTQEQKLLSLICLIRSRGQALITKDHQDLANTLANNLETKVKLFFNLPFEDKKNKFISFKEECSTEIERAKELANCRDYKQLFFDILQTLTVIGALIGVAQWFRTGRYSLFPTPTTTLLGAIEETKHTLKQLT